MLLCRANSFSGDTLVAMAGGSMLPIAEVQVGDQVLAYDFDTGTTVAREVTATMPHSDWLLEAHLSDGSTLTVTEDHRFWSVTDNGWVELQDLDTTDVLLTPDGATVTVDWLDWDAGADAAAWDLTVDQEHNFFVAADDAAAEPVLVHNQGAPDPWCGIALTDDVFRKLDSAITTEEARTSVRAVVDGLVLSGRLEGAERLLTYVSRFDEGTVARMMQNANIDRTVTNTVIDEKVEYAFGITRFESRASNGPDDLKRALTNRDEPIEFRRIGEPGFDVYEPFNANRVTDIDRFSPNFDELESGAQAANPLLIEEKSASFANDIGGWVDSNIFAKHGAYSRSRPLIPGFEESEIVFDFSDAGVSLDPPFRSAVEQAISTLNASDPYGVRVVFP